MLSRIAMSTMISSKSVALHFGRNMATISKIGVVGMGSMGHGIVQSSAEAGYQVVAVDLSEEALQKGMAHIKQSVDMIAAKGVKKGKMTEEEGEKYKTCMDNIEAATNIAALHDCDLVIEAIVENIDIKNKFYSDLSKVAKPEAILASNTSSLPIKLLSNASGRADRTIGLHFFNPVQLMKLVEVVRTEDTNNEVFDAAQAYVKKIGKVAVACKDTPGFVVNRLLVPYIGQALLLLERGDAEIEGIDNAMMLGAGHPMGPLKLADYVGLDVCLSILQGWKKNFPDEPAYVVPDILKKKVSAGHLGKKNGKGFYNWDGMKTTGVNN